MKFPFLGIKWKVHKQTTESPVDQVTTRTSSEQRKPEAGSDDKAVTSSRKQRKKGAGCWGEKVREQKRKGWKHKL